MIVPLQLAERVHQVTIVAVRLRVHRSALPLQAERLRQAITEAARRRRDGMSVLLQRVERPHRAIIVAVRLRVHRSALPLQAERLRQAITEVARRREGMSVLLQRVERPRQAIIVAARHRGPLSVLLHKVERLHLDMSGRPHRLEVLRRAIIAPSRLSDPLRPAERRVRSVVNQAGLPSAVLRRAEVQLLVMTAVARRNQVELRSDPLRPAGHRVHSAASQAGPPSVVLPLAGIRLRAITAVARLNRTELRSDHPVRVDLQPPPEPGAHNQAGAVLLVGPVALSVVSQVELHSDLRARAGLLRPQEPGVHSLVEALPVELPRGLVAAPQDLTDHLRAPPAQVDLADLSKN